MAGAGSGSAGRSTGNTTPRQIDLSDIALAGGAVSSRAY
jgi:hypothetical protein